MLARMLAHERRVVSVLAADKLWRPPPLREGGGGVGSVGGVGGGCGGVKGGGGGGGVVKGGGGDGIEKSEAARQSEAAAAARAIVDSLRPMWQPRQHDCGDDTATASLQLSVILIPPLSQPSCDHLADDRGRAR